MMRDIQESLAWKLTHGAAELGIRLDENQTAQFMLYLRELKEWNQKVNLTAITEDDDVIQKHFLDSLTVLPLIPGGVATVLDIGTGGGLPGIPLKIVRPELAVYLMDAIRKKAEFLTFLNQKLGYDMKILNMRAEDAGQSPDYREQFDWVISRAVADMAVLAEYSLPLVKIGGIFCAMKGKDVDDEVKNARYAVKVLGGRLIEIVHVQVPGTDLIRHCIMVEKVQPTPAKYPRKAGMPEKRPLVSVNKV